MTQELIYTSAPRGLKPGSRGFCTVLSTQGMSAPLATALESLSGYRAVFPPNDPRADQNPVVYSHLRLTVAGKTYSVLSRISDYGLDYSQRANKIAHHLVLDRREQSGSGPAAVLSAPGMMETIWSGEPRVIPTGRAVAGPIHPPTICRTWQTAAGDAGWAGALAESFQTDPQRQAYLVVEPGMDVLALITEALSLLPAEIRWNVTFSSYFTSLPPGATCLWRCVLAGSPEAQQSRRFVQALRIDLTQPMAAAMGGALIEQARTGRIAQAASASIAPMPTPGMPEPAETVPLAEVGPPSAPTVPERAAASGGLKTPPPPPRKRTRTLADVPDPPRRGWLVPSVTALVMLLLIGSVGVGIYQWWSAGDLAVLVAWGGKKIKPVGAEKKVAVRKAGENSKSNITETTSPIVIPQTDDTPPAAPDETSGVEGSPMPKERDQSDRMKHPTTPADVSSDSPSKNAKQKEPTGPIYHWVSLSESSDGPLIELDLETGSDSSLALFVPEPFQEKLEATPSKDNPDRLNIKCKFSAEWMNLAHFELQDTKSDKTLLTFEWSGHKFGALRTKLSWCVVRIGKIAPQYLFFQNPHKMLARSLENNKIAWDPGVDVVGDIVTELPLNATINIQAGDTTFQFSNLKDEKDPHSSARSIIILSQRAGRAIWQSTGLIMPEDWEPIIGIRIDIGKSENEIMLSLLHTKRMISQLKQSFNMTMCLPVKNELERNDHEIIPVIPTYASPPPITFASFIANPSNIVGDVRRGISEYRRYLEKVRRTRKEKGASMTEAQIKVYDQHEQYLIEIIGKKEGEGIIDELKRIADRIQALEENFKSATITAAHIYYKVHGPDDKSLEVPIINILEEQPPKSASSQEPTPKS